MVIGSGLKLAGLRRRFWKFRGVLSVFTLPKNKDRGCWKSQTLHQTPRDCPTDPPLAQAYPFAQTFLMKKLICNKESSSLFFIHFTYFVTS